VHAGISSGWVTVITVPVTQPETSPASSTSTGPRPRRPGRRVVTRDFDPTYESSLGMLRRRKSRDASADMAKQRLNLFITRFSSRRIISARNGTSNLNCQDGVPGRLITQFQHWHPSPTAPGPLRPGLGSNRPVRPKL
jgi:hypothetical protein